MRGSPYVPYKSKFGSGPDKQDVLKKKKDKVYTLWRQLGQFEIKKRHLH